MPQPVKKTSFVNSRKVVTPPSPTGGKTPIESFGGFQILYLGMLTGTPDTPSDNIFRVWSDGVEVWGSLNGTTRLLWPNDALINTDGSQVDVANTVTETDLYSGTIPANMLGTNGAVRLTLAGDWLDNAAGTLRIRVYLNATVVMDEGSIGLTDSTVRHKWQMDVTILANGATNAQKVSASFTGARPTNTNTLAIGDSSLVSIPIGAGLNTAAEDTTADMTIRVTAKWSAASASSSMRKEIAILQNLGGVASGAGGGGGSTSPLTTKGDLWGYDTGDNRLPVGSDGTALLADSASALGLSYGNVYSLFQDEANVIQQRATVDVIGTYMQAIDDAANLKTKLYGGFAHYDSIVDSDQHVALVSDTADAVTATSIDVTGAGWITDTWKRCRILIYDSTGVTLRGVRVITSNDSDTINWSGAVAGITIGDIVIVQPANPVYRRLQEAIAGGHASVLYRKASGEQDFSISSGDAVTYIIGDKAAGALVSASMTVTRPGVILQNLQFNQNGKTLTLNQLGVTCVGCIFGDPYSASNTHAVVMSGQATALIACAIAGRTGSIPAITISATDCRIQACQFVGNGNSVAHLDVNNSGAVIVGNIFAGFSETGYFVDLQGATIASINGNLFEIPSSGAGAIDATGGGSVGHNIAGNIFNIGTLGTNHAFIGVIGAPRSLIANNIFKTGGSVPSSISVKWVVCDSSVVGVNIQGNVFLGASSVSGCAICIETLTAGAIITGNAFVTSTSSTNYWIALNVCGSTDYVFKDNVVTSSAFVTFQRWKPITVNSYTITNISVANPTEVTTSGAHGLVTGDSVTITGSNSTPTIDGVRTVTVTAYNKFTVAVNVTVLGTTGTVIRGTATAAIGPRSTIRGNPGLPDIQAYQATFIEDFVTANAAAALPAGWVEAKNGAGSGLTNAKDVRNGLITLVTGGTNGNDDCIYLDTDHIAVNNQDASWQVNLPRVSSVASVRIRVGFMARAQWAVLGAVGAFPPAGAPNDYFILEFDTASGISAVNWVMRWRTGGGAEQTFNTGIPAVAGSTQLLMGVDRNSSNRPWAYAQGVFINPNVGATGIGATLMTIGAFIETLTGADKQTDVDMFAWGDSRV